MNIASWGFKLKRFAGECRRVLRITKKPDSIEFKTIVKVSSLGMAIVGSIGFVMTMFKLLFFP